MNRHVMSSPIHLPRNATPEMVAAKKDLIRFRAMGNFFGAKQADAKLRSLIRKANIDQ